MEDQITVPFTTGPWKFEARRAGDLSKPAAVMLVSTSTDVENGDRVIFALRDDWLGPQDERRQYAKTLIEAAPDLFQELANTTEDLQALAIMLRETGESAQATEIECRIASIQSTLARATKIEHPSGLGRYMVVLRAPGINVTAENLREAKRHTRADAIEFARSLNWEIASRAVAARYLDVTSKESVVALSGAAVECTGINGLDYECDVLMNVVVEAETPDQAEAAALALAGGKQAR